MATYKNTFYSPKIPGSTEQITTAAQGEEYCGHLIYHRLKSTCRDGNIFDIVNGGECIGMCAGINGARRRIDEILAISGTAGEGK
jgi:hypothetical protein